MPNPLLHPLPATVRRDVETLSASEIAIELHAIDARRAALVREVDCRAAAGEDIYRDAVLDVCRALGLAEGWPALQEWR